MTWTIQSRFVRARVQSLGAMLGPAWFALPNMEVQPFAIAPWAEDCSAEHQRLPGLLKRLRGEWPCVPFGIERDCNQLPSAWQPAANAGAPLELLPHGRSSNVEWQLATLKDDRIELVLEYPRPHPIKLLRRVVAASTSRPELTLSLAIEVRAPCALPIGVHPTLRLPVEPRRAVLELGRGARLWTSPVPVDPAIARFTPDVRGVRLDRVPLRDGAHEDITRLPLRYAAEEVVLASGHSGRASLHNLDESYTVAISWDSAVFPACQLWLSNRGRDSYPWNGRFLALGIEPVCAAFDLGTRVSQHRQNPLWQSGLPCTVSFSPDQSFETTYSIAVS